MTAISVDVDAQTIRVEGGVMWAQAVEAAAEHGFAVLHGSSPDVGIAGYTLGGGMGWYGRKHGLATNSVTAVELVTSDGTLLRADKDNNPEVFWALRGGGGNFGVVTALEFAMFEFSTAYAGMMIWDRSDADAVLRRGPNGRSTLQTKSRRHFAFSICRPSRRFLRWSVVVRSS